MGVSPAEKRQEKPPGGYDFTRGISIFSLGFWGLMMMAWSGSDLQQLIFDFGPRFQ